MHSTAHVQRRTEQLNAENCLPHSKTPPITFEKKDATPCPTPSWPPVMISLSTSGSQEKKISMKEIEWEILIVDDLYSHVFSQINQ